MTGREENEIKKNLAIKNKLKNLPDFVSDWHETLKTRGMQAASRFDYVQKISRFIKTMNIQNPEDITYSIVTKWINMNSYKSNGEETSGAHRQATWSVMKNFLMYLQEGDMIESVIKVALDGKLRVGGNERPKGDNQEELKNKRIIIGEEEFNKLLAEPDNKRNYITAIRDKAILAVFMTTGMREMALIEMNIDDIDLENLKMYYIDKRKKYFTRSINDVVIESLNSWLKIRHIYAEQRNPSSPALFLSNQGKRMDPKTVRDMIRRCGRDALGYDITPHKLRSGFITIMYNHTHDIEMVRRIIGHSNVATTQRYIRVKDEVVESTRTEILDSIFN